MRKIRFVLSVVALAVPLVSATPATASSYPTCVSLWHDLHYDGKIHAYGRSNCDLEMNDGAAGDDPNWGDNAGPFRNSDGAASSVINTGYRDTYDVVALYDYPNYAWEYGYGCITREELYVDDLSRNTFTPRKGGTKEYNMDDAISSHKWVTKSACTKFIH